MALEIIIASARCLTRISPTPNMKIYVVVSIIGATVKELIRAQTDIDRQGGGNPTWNFPVKFDVDCLKKDLKASLVFVLKCEDGKGNKDLGEVHVAVSELLQSVEGGNSMGSYVAVSHPVREASGETVAWLDFRYKFGGSPTSTDTPADGFATSRSMGVYPPQGYNYPAYPLPPSATGYGDYPPPAAGYGGYPQPPPQSSNTYPPPYPPYNVGPSAAPPSSSHYTPPPTYPPYNVEASTTPPSYYMPPSPYPPYNVRPSPMLPYPHPPPSHPSHVQARATRVEQRSVAKKKKSVWGSALGMAGAVTIGVLSGVTSSSYELPSTPAPPEFSDLTGGFQVPDPSGYAPQDLSFINNMFPYIDYS